MADAWGGAWGEAWGVSWGAVVAAAVVDRSPDAYIKEPRRRQVTRYRIERPAYEPPPETEIEVPPDPLADILESPRVQTKKVERQEPAPVQIGPIPEEIRKLAKPRKRKAKQEAKGQSEAQQAALRAAQDEEDAIIALLM